MSLGSQLSHANELFESVLNVRFDANDLFWRNAQATQNPHVVIEPGCDLNSRFTQLLHVGK